MRTITTKCGVFTIGKIAQGDGSRPIYRDSKIAPYAGRIIRSGRRFKVWITSADDSFFVDGDGFVTRNFDEATTYKTMTDAVAHTFRPVERGGNGE